METATLPLPDTIESPEPPASSREKINLWNRFNLFLGKSAMAQVMIVEAAGATNDASWIHPHHGVTPEQEMTGMPTDLALWTVLPKQEHGHTNPEVSKIKKFISKLGEGAVLAALGYGAQKMGVEVMDHVHSSYNSGAGEYIVPAVSKIGTLTAAKNGSRILRERAAHQTQGAPTLAHA